jgi:hypothetical protein
LKLRTGRKTGRCPDPPGAKPLDLKFLNLAKPKNPDAGKNIACGARRNADIT